MGSVEFRIDVVETAGSWVVSCKSSAGSAVRVVPTPFTDVELERRLRDLEISIVRSTGTPTTRAGTTPVQVARSFGSQLTDVLLAGDTAILFDRCREKARREGTDLRVLVSPVGPNVARVPWEFATDPGKDYEHLALRMPVVRSPHLMEQVPPLAVEPPLRVLGVVSRPTDSPPLDVAQERRSITAALGRLSADLVTIEWLDGDRWPDLAGALRDGHWNVLHYVGHGGFDPDLGTGYIELTDEGGRATRVPATDLARHVADSRDLRLVVLNSCESATSSTDDGVFSSTAARLMREGLPAVVAMQYEISDPSALAFSFGLYDALARDLPLDRAVTHARDAVKMTTRSLEWATPVLFLASDETRIFSVRGRSTSTDTGPQPGRVLGAVKEVITGRSTPAPAGAAGPTATEVPKQVSRTPHPAPRPVPRSRPPAPAQGAPRLLATVPVPAPRAVAAIPGHMLAVVTAVGDLRVVGLRDGAERARCALAPGGRVDPATRVRATPWPRHVVTLHASGAVVVWDLETEVPVRVLSPPLRGAVRDLAVSADGRWIATTGGDLAVRVFGTDGEQALGVRLTSVAGGSGLGAPLRYLGPVAFSRGGKVLVGADDGFVREVRGSGAVTAGWPHPAPVASLTCGDVPGTMVTGCHDGRVRVWSRSGERGLLRRLDAGSKVLAVDRRAGLLVAVAEDRRCHVWRSDGAHDEVMTVPADHAAVSVPASEPVLVTVARKGQAQSWDLTTGQVAAPTGGAP